MRFVVVALFLLAPPETVKLAYKFEKGMVYREVQKRHFEMVIFQKQVNLETEVTFATDVERTILEVDETAHPRAERVVVRTYGSNYLKHPEGKTGEKAYACQGKTFVWRRLKDRWALFEGEEEVTSKHDALVNHLKNWRDARLPKEPVALGDTWEVAAGDFLRTAGMTVPGDVTGAALFKLEKIEKGIALIRFHIRFSYRAGGNDMDAEQKGEWRFDIKKGRDVDSSLKGTIEINEKRTGHGKVTIDRKVTYP